MEKRSFTQGFVSALGLVGLLYGFTAVAGGGQVTPLVIEERQARATEEVARQLALIREEGILLRSSSQRPLQVRVTEEIKVGGELKMEVKGSYSDPPVRFKQESVGGAAGGQ